MYKSKPKARVVSFITIGIACQVFVLGICAFKISPTQVVGDNSLGNALTLAGFVSGAGNHFGFFAPGVVSQFRTRYKVLQGDVILSEGQLNNGNTETTFRYHNMVENFFMQNMEDVSTPQRSMMSSWAARLIAGELHADRVELIIEAYVLPTMENYRHGEKPRWITYRTASFARPAKAQI